jgi:hypothetical protein
VEARAGTSRLINPYESVLERRGPVRSDQLAECSHICRYNRWAREISPVECERMGTGTA